MTFAAISARIVEAVDSDDRRRAIRSPVAIDARVRPFGAEGAAALVVNLSATGFMAESTGAFALGARIWLILPDRERATAIVKWIDGRRLGAESPRRWRPCRTNLWRSAGRRLPAGSRRRSA